MRNLQRHLAAQEPPLLTQFPEAEKVRRVRVVLRRVNLGSGGDGIACIVTITLEETGSFRIRATGPHAYAAISRAVERIRTPASTGMVGRVSM